MAGVASGLVLYAGTMVFVAVAGRWEPFRRHVVEKYQEAAEVSLGEALALSLLIWSRPRRCFDEGCCRPSSSPRPCARGRGWTWLAYVG